MTTSRYFTTGELARLRSAIIHYRNEAREAALDNLDPHGEWVGSEEERVTFEDEINRCTRLIAKLKAPCMY